MGTLPTIPPSLYVYSIQTPIREFKLSIDLGPLVTGTGTVTIDNGKAQTQSPGSMPGPSPYTTKAL